MGVNDLRVIYFKICMRYGVRQKKTRLLYGQAWISYEHKVRPCPECYQNSDLLMGVMRPGLISCVVTNWYVPAVPEWCQTGGNHNPMYKYTHIFTSIIYQKDRKDRQSHTDEKGDGNKKEGTYSSLLKPLWYCLSLAQCSRSLVVCFSEYYMFWPCSELARMLTPGKIGNCLECFSLGNNCSHCRMMDSK